MQIDTLSPPESGVRDVRGQQLEAEEGRWDAELAPAQAAATARLAAGTGLQAAATSEEEALNRDAWLIELPAAVAAFGLTRVGT